MKVLAVVGTKKSGKTTVAEFIIRALAKEGYRVGAAKHIHHQFTMDSKGKDTRKFARAGARLVVSVAPGEVATLRKVDINELQLEDLLALGQDAGVDVIVLEGFREYLRARADVPKIVTAKDMDELRVVLKQLTGPIVAVSGVVAKSTAEPKHSVRFVDVKRQGDTLVQLVKQQFGWTAEKGR